eukprot:UN27699
MKTLDFGIMPKMPKYKVNSRGKKILKQCKSQQGKEVPKEGQKASSKFCKLTTFKLNQRLLRFYHLCPVLETLSFHVFLILETLNLHDFSTIQETFCSCENIPEAIFLWAGEFDF